MVQTGSAETQVRALCYHPPDEAALRRAAEIRRVVEAEFGDGVPPSGRRTAFRLRSTAQHPAAALSHRNSWKKHGPVPCGSCIPMLRCTAIRCLNPAIESLSRWIAASASPPSGSTASGCTPFCATWRRAARRFLSSVLITSSAWPIFEPWSSGRRSTALACICT